jgi:hypothetical protein
MKGSLRTNFAVFAVAADRKSSFIRLKVRWTVLSIKLALVICSQSESKSHETCSDGEMAFRGYKKNEI